MNSLMLSTVARVHTLVQEAMLTNASGFFFARGEWRSERRHAYQDPALSRSSRRTRIFRSGPGACTDSPPREPRDGLLREGAANRRRLKTRAGIRSRGNTVFRTRNDNRLCAYSLVEGNETHISLRRSPAFTLTYRSDREYRGFAILIDRLFTSAGCSMSGSALKAPSSLSVWRPSASASRYAAARFPVVGPP
jgi:hypothetical protein